MLGLLHWIRSHQYWLSDHLILPLYRPIEWFGEELLDMRGHHLGQYMGLVDLSVFIYGTGLGALVALIYRRFRRTALAPSTLT